jgi:excinuclease ABC subunit C
MRSIRDEVHRFGITFHRQQRSKGALKNELESIAGIGTQTVTQLLQTFKSVKNIRQQKPEVLEQIIGKRKTTLLQAYFNNLAEPE